MFDLPPRTAVHLAVSSEKLRAAGGQYEATIDDVEAFECLDCGAKTLTLAGAQEHQRTQKGHGRLLRAKAWLAKRWPPSARPNVKARPAEVELATYDNERRPRPLAWTCHACGATRPNAMIGLLVRLRFWPEHFFSFADYAGSDAFATFREQVLYCIDRPECLRKAATIRFVKEAIDMPENEMHFVTEDAAVHRFFKRDHPFHLDALDEKVLASVTAVLRTEEAIERAMAEVDAKPEEHQPPPGFERPTRESLRELAAKAPERLDQFLDRFRSAMDEESALLCRELRVDEGYSWRAVARWFGESSLAVLSETDDANQLAGMALCILAAEKLGQHYRDPVWNRFPSADA